MLLLQIPPVYILYMSSQCTNIVVNVVVNVVVVVVNVGLILVEFLAQEIGRELLLLDHQLILPCCLQTSEGVSDVGQQIQIHNSVQLFQWYSWTFCVLGHHRLNIRDHMTRKVNLIQATWLDESMVDPQELLFGDTLSCCSLLECVQLCPQLQVLRTEFSLTVTLDKLVLIWLT